jgi:hypothetical protein
MNVMNDGDADDEDVGLEDGEEFFSMLFEVVPVFGRRRGTMGAAMKDKASVRQINDSKRCGGGLDCFYHVSIKNDGHTLFFICERCQDMVGKERSKWQRKT